MSIQIDLDAIEGVGRGLDAAASSLVGAGGSAPHVVDAGEFSALVMSVLAGITDGAASLAHGAADAGAGVARCVVEYRAADGASADQFMCFAPGARR